MRYWLFDDNRVGGPFALEELLQRESFSAESLVCPEGCTGAREDDWRCAWEIEELRDAALRKVATRPAQVVRAGASPEPPSAGVSDEIEDLFRLALLDEKMDRLSESVRRLWHALRGRDQDLAGLKSRVLKLDGTLEVLTVRTSAIQGELDATQEIKSKLTGIHEKLGDNRQHLAEISAEVKELQRGLASIMSRDPYAALRLEPLTRAAIQLPEAPPVAAPPPAPAQPFPAVAPTGQALAPQTVLSPAPAPPTAAAPAMSATLPEAPSPAVPLPPLPEEPAAEAPASYLPLPESPLPPLPEELSAAEAPAQLPPVPPVPLPEAPADAAPVPGLAQDFSTEDFPEPTTCPEPAAPGASEAGPPQEAQASGSGRRRLALAAAAVSVGAFAAWLYLATGTTEPPPASVVASVPAAPPPLPEPVPAQTLAPAKPPETAVPASPPAPAAQTPPSGPAAAVQLVQAYRLDGRKESVLELLGAPGTPADGLSRWAADPMGRDKYLVTYYSPQVDPATRKPTIFEFEADMARQAVRGLNPPAQALAAKGAAAAASGLAPPEPQSAKAATARKVPALSAKPAESAAPASRRPASFPRGPRRAAPTARARSPKQAPARGRGAPAGPGVAIRKGGAVGELSKLLGLSGSGSAAADEPVAGRSLRSRKGRGRAPPTTKPAEDELLGPH